MHNTNSNALSERANVPTYRPDYEAIPIAFTVVIPFIKDIVNAFGQIIFKPVEFDLF